MTIPAQETPVPEQVRELARGAALTPVGENGIGGLTFHTDDHRFIKVGPRNAESSMRDEAERMPWAASWTRVPVVLEQGDSAEHEWLVTSAIDGESAVSPHWIADPATAVRAVGQGLRLLHDALPSAQCRGAGASRPASGMPHDAASGCRSSCAMLPRLTGWSSATATPARPTPC